MRTKLVSGWHLIINLAACERWMKKHKILDRFKCFPHDYPVLARCDRTYDGHSIPDYIHPCDAENMAKELKNAVKFLRAKQLKKGGSMRR